MAKNDDNLPVSQLLKNLVDLILQRTTDITPIHPVACHELLDHPYERIRVDPLVRDLYPFFVMVGCFPLEHESPQQHFQTADDSQKASLKKIFRGRSWTITFLPMVFIGRHIPTANAPGIIFHNTNQYFRNVFFAG